MSHDHTESPLRGWHFRKELHFGHVLTTGAIIVSMALAWAELQSTARDHERRLGRVEEEQSSDDTRERLTRLEVLLETILDRLDREDRG